MQNQNNEKKILTVKELKSRIPQVINAIPAAEAEAKGIMPYIVFSYMGTDGKEHNVKPRRCGGGYLYDSPYHQTKDRVFRIEYCINDVWDARIVLEGCRYEYLLIDALLTGLSKSMIFSSDMLNAPVCFSYRIYSNQDDILIGICDCAAEEDEEGHIVIKLKASPEERYDINFDKLREGSGFDFAFIGEYCEYLEWEKKQQAEKETEEGKTE